MMTNDPIGSVEYASSLLWPIRLSFDILFDDDTIHYCLFDLPMAEQPWYGYHQSKLYGSGMLPLSDVAGKENATPEAVAEALCREIGITKSFTIGNVRRNYVDLHIPEFVRRSLIRPNHPVESPSAQRARAYILFADLRGFSTWSLSVNPEQVTRIFEVISERVVQMLIDYHYDYWKLLGDGIMLVWEVTDDETTTADNAIGAAFELHKKYWYYWKEDEAHLPEGFGIAICGGDVVKYASATFFESVVITDYLGPVVNLAARLQSIAKAGQVLVNKQVSKKSRFNGYSFENVSDRLKNELDNLKGIPDSERVIFQVIHKYFGPDWLNFCHTR